MIEPAPAESFRSRKVPLSCPLQTRYLWENTILLNHNREDDSENLVIKIKTKDSFNLQRWAYNIPRFRRSSYSPRRREQQEQLNTLCCLTPKKRECREQNHTCMILPWDPLLKSLKETLAISASSQRVLLLANKPYGLSAHED